MDLSTTKISITSAEHELTKKEYQSPEFVLYGNISEITLMVDMMGNSDGSTGMMDRT